MSQAEEAFLAGSRGFSLALFGPLTERAGVRPRLAGEPSQAMMTCAGSSGLLLIELTPEWLPAIEHLRRQAPALRMVVAVPPDLAAVGDRLAAYGVAVAPWDGQAGPVLEVVARVLGVAPAATAVATAPAPAAPPAAAGDLFTPTPAPLPAAAAAGPTWPTTVPGEDEAEGALVRSLRGRLPSDAPLAAAAAAAVAALTPLERQALAGEPLPFDATPIYRAAVTRLRTSVVLAAAPPPPVSVDHDAVQGLLAELDVVLGQVNALAAQVPEAHQAELEAVRNGLVRVAVDFSEVAQALGQGAPPAGAPEAAPHRPRQPAEAKVLSVHAAAAERAAAPGRPDGWLVALALALLVAGGFHAWRWASAPTPVPPPTLAGAPANTMTFSNDSGQFLMAIGGATVDPAALQRFIEQEKARGNTVREIAPGTWTIEPEPRPRGGRTP